MPASDAREIAALVPMAVLLAALAFTVNERTRRCACLVHGGSNPTAFAWTDAGLWRCHSCGAGGDKIALIRVVRKCLFSEAVAFLAGLAGVEYRAGTVPRHEVERVKREREAELATASVLVGEWQSALIEAHETVWALNDLRRKASRRLCEIENGKLERWPGEADWAWEALREITAQMSRADTAYCLAAFSAPVNRATFALHPELRPAMIAATLEQGFIRGAKGQIFEVALE